MGHGQVRPFGAADGPVAWNPALLAGTDTTWIVGFAASRPFGMADLTTTSLSVARRHPRLGVSIGVESFGGDAYGETTARIAVGATVAEPFRARFASAGVALDVTQVTIAGWERSEAVSVTPGLSFRPSPRLSFSAVAESAVSWSRGELLLEHCRTFALGGTYVPGEAVALSGFVAREEGGRWRSEAAISVAPHPWVRLRLGRASGPSGFVGGFDLAWRGFRLGYSVRLHPELDPTHGLSIGAGR